MQMAGLGYSEEQIELLDVATSFCRDKSPIARVRKLMDSDLGYDADVWAEMAALGWTAIAIPEAHGGVGLSLAEVVPVVEQMGRHLMASPLVSSTLAAQALIIGGSEQQTAHWPFPKRMATGIFRTLQPQQRLRVTQSICLARSCLSHGRRQRISLLHRLC